MRASVTPNPRSLSRHGRRGYLYVGVMITALIVALVGVSALSVARVTLDTTQRQTDFSAAQALARSAIEHAVFRIDDKSNWRTEFSLDTEYPDPPQPLGTGTFTWMLSDPDGSLVDDDADGVWVTGIGRAGDAIFAERVLLLPTGQALSCLEAAFHCDSNVTLGFWTDLTTDQFISANGSISAGTYGATIFGDAQATGTISGPVTGTASTGVNSRRMPSDMALEYYLANGTWIDLSNVPVGGSQLPLIELVTFSPAINPYGSITNPEGIYVIDCAGQGLTLRNCRVLGSLVLLNSTLNTHIDGTISWSPAVPNYPTLLVNGDIDLRYSNGVLNETALATNFNPPGALYEGDEDTDTTDTYPSKITGLVYVSGTVRFPFQAPNSHIDGSLVCRGLAGYSDATVEYRSTFLDTPPPGFASGNPMRIAPGTWHRTALP